MSYTILLRGYCKDEKGGTACNVLAGDTSQPTGHEKLKTSVTTCHTEVFRCVQVSSPVGPVVPPPLLSLSRPLHVAPLSPELVPPPPVELVIAVSHWTETHTHTLFIIMRV